MARACGGAWTQWCTLNQAHHPYARFVFEMVPTEEANRIAFTGLFPSSNPTNLVRPRVPVASVIINSQDHGSAQRRSRDFKTDIPPCSFERTSYSLQDVLNDVHGAGHVPLVMACHVPGAVSRARRRAHRSACPGVSTMCARSCMAGCPS